MQPQNRLRSGASSVICSRCTSMLSMNHSRMTSRYTSQASLSHMPSHKKAPPTKDTNMPKPESEVEPPILCKICLIDCPVKETYRIQQCKCIFCTEVCLNWSHEFFCKRVWKLRAHFDFTKKSSGAKFATVWKFQDFNAIQILREINFDHFFRSEFWIC